MPKTQVVPSSSIVESLETRRLMSVNWAAPGRLIHQDAASADFPTIDGRGETIAIIDSGVDYNHPSMGGGWGNKVIGGYNYEQNNSNPFPSYGHGTGSAGEAAGYGYWYGGQYYQGIAPGAKIVAFRQSGWYQVKASLDWVIANRWKMNIVSVNLVDWITETAPPPYASELATLAGMGVTIVAPVANVGTQYGIQWPVLDAHVYGAGSVNQYDQMSSFDQHGSALDMLAPAENINVPWYDSGRHLYVPGATGNSWAAPQITGAAALIKQVNPNFTPDQIMGILKDSGKRIYDPVTHGTVPRLDLDAAIRLAYQRSGQATPQPTQQPPTQPAPTPTTTEAPYSGTPFSAGQVIQAENYDKGGEGVAYHDTTSNNEGGAYRTDGVDIETTGDSGGGYDVGWTHKGEWLNYTVNAATAGTYTVNIRIAANGTGGALHLNVDGAAKTSSIAVPNTGNWQKYATITTSLALTAGKHVISLVMDADGTGGGTGNINWWSFNAPASTPTPSPAPTGTETPYYGTPFSTGVAIGAEDYNKGGEGVGYHDTTTANEGGQYRNDGVDLEKTLDPAGGGYNVAYTKKGEWLDYTVNVATAGTYTVSFRVANAAAGGAFHLTQDGVDKSGTIAIPSTGGFQNWTTITKQVTLSAGVHVIGLVMDAEASNGFVGNFNWFKIG